MTPVEIVHTMRGGTARRLLVPWSKFLELSSAAPRVGPLLQHLQLRALLVEAGFDLTRPIDQSEDQLNGGMVYEQVELSRRVSAPLSPEPATQRPPKTVRVLAVVFAFLAGWGLLALCILLGDAIIHAMGWWRT